MRSNILKTIQLPLLSEKVSRYVTLLNYHVSFDVFFSRKSIEEKTEVNYVFSRCREIYHVNKKSFQF